MTTKPPSPIKPASDQALEKVAYASVSSIPTVEPHDQDRLGFNVWRFLKFRIDPLDIAVRSAGARLLITEDEAVRKIKEHLKNHGIEVT